MQDIVKRIMEKTGITEEQAKQATETVLTFLKEKLPAPLATQLDTMVTGARAASKLAEAAKGLRGIFGS